MRGLLTRLLAFIGICLFMILSVVLAAPLVLLQAFVLSELWRWFVASTFHLPDLSLPNAVGVLLIGTVLRAFNRKPKEEDDGTDWKEALEKEAFIAIAQALLLLGLLFVGKFVYTYFM